MARVVKFAKDLGLSENAVEVLEEEEIDGSVLHMLDAAKLKEDGMKRGPREKLMEALDKIFERPGGV